MGVEQRWEYRRFPVRPEASNVLGLQLNPTAPQNSQQNPIAEQHQLTFRFRHRSHADTFRKFVVVAVDAAAAALMVPAVGEIGLPSFPIDDPNPSALPSGSSSPAVFPPATSRSRSRFRFLRVAAASVGLAEEADEGMDMTATAPTTTTTNRAPQRDARERGRIRVRYGARFGERARERLLRPHRGPVRGRAGGCDVLCVGACVSSGKLKPYPGSCIETATMG